MYQTFQNASLKTESNRGGKLAVHDAQSYNQKQTTKNCIRSRCKMKLKTKLPSKTQKFNIFKKVPDNCAPSTPVTQLTEAKYPKHL